MDDSRCVRLFSPQWLVPGLVPLVRRLCDLLNHTSGMAKTLLPFSNIRSVFVTNVND
jgi:hypothetical protein